MGAGLPTRFNDRSEAGTLLANALAEYRESDPVVYGVARGGVVVAATVARQLDCPMDVIVARKIAPKWNPEAGFGAIAEGGVEFYDRGLVQRLNFTREDLRSLEEEIRLELDRRVERYRGARQRLSAEGKSAIVVDDGVASGYSLAAALEVIRADGPERLAAAVPVAAHAGVSLVSQHCDRLLTLFESAPREPFAVGLYYRDFTQVSDEEVVELIRDGFEND